MGPVTMWNCRIHLLIWFRCRNNHSSLSHPEIQTPALMAEFLEGARSSHCCLPVSQLRKWTLRRRPKWHSWLAVSRVAIGPPAPGSPVRVPDFAYVTDAQDFPPVSPAVLLSLWRSRVRFPCPLLMPTVGLSSEWSSRIAVFPAQEKGYFSLLLSCDRPRLLRLGGPEWVFISFQKVHACLNHVGTGVWDLARTPQRLQPGWRYVCGFQPSSSQPEWVTQNPHVWGTRERFHGFKSEAVT